MKYQFNDLILRDGALADIPLIRAMEELPENQSGEGSWTAAKHTSTMKNKDTGYLIAEIDGVPVAVLILKGYSKKDVIFLHRNITGAENRHRGRKIFRALKLLCFEQWRSHRLWLVTQAQHTGAQQLYQSEGLKREGVLRNHARDGTAWVDSVAYGMLEEDYKEFKKAQQAKRAEAK